MSQPHPAVMPRTPFTKLLKMQLVAADLDAGEVALRAGIPRRRVYEIMCGRTHPSDVETAALFYAPL